MRALLLSVLVLFSSPGLAQQIPDAFREDIVRLIEATGSLKLGEQMGAAVAQQIIASAQASDPNVPPRVVEIITEVTTSYIGKFMNSQETLDSIVQLYAKYFTHEEIRAIAAFYETPTGRKAINALPALTAESMQDAQRRMMAIVPELQAELARRLSEEGFQLE